MGSRGHLRQGLYFVTGTDTGVGKSVVSAVLANEAFGCGYKTAIVKPVQTGVSGDELGDRAWLRAVLPMPIGVYGCYSFRKPLSPHLASRMEKSHIRTDKIIKFIRSIKKQYQVIIVEGIGGLMVPLKKKYKIIDLIEDLKASVILVSANKLGVLSTTLLNEEVLLKRKISVKGIILNNADKSPKDISRAYNGRALRELIVSPFLGELPYLNNMRNIRNAQKIMSAIRWKK